MIEETKNNNTKTNYQDKNNDFIEKLKQKRQKQQQEKLILQKKQLHRKQVLKKKVLQQASRNRQNKLKQISDINNTTNEFHSQKRVTNFESLPKIHQEKEKDEQQENNNKKDHKKRYLSFIQSLQNTNKSKKQIQENKIKKKQEKFNRLKQDLGYNQVESKVNFRKTNYTAAELGRSQSADKIASLMEISQSEVPKSNKNFKRKNQEYIEKIKKKRSEEQAKKTEQKEKKEKLKQKLKGYVMVTVKKNVMEGMYDDEFDKKPKKSAKQIRQRQFQSDQQGGSQNQGSESEVSSPQKKKARKMRSFPYVTDLNQWKKKNRLQPDTKVFIVTGGYNELKKALRDRGWVQNPDSKSPCFNWKYSLQGKQIDYDNLHDNQLVNHYEKNGVITTKTGLMRSLRNLVWINDTSEDTFFPKCFDLNDEDDFYAFQVHFKVCKALSILKIYQDSSKNKTKNEQKNKKLVEDLKMRTEVAIQVCKKNIEDLDDIIDKKKQTKIITEKQWEILGSDELDQEGLARKKHEEWLKSIDCKFGSVAKKVEKKEKKKKKKKQVEKQDQNNNNDQQGEEQLQQTDELLQKVQELLEEYKNRFPQFHLTGHNNIWILKPSGLSRGRGIICYNNFVEIQHHIKSKQSQWIAQKYIENPFVVLKRKFDIRQWVLVTDFNPLTIWLYDECYIRFSAVDYDPKQVNNKFIHLTNNCIGSNFKDFDKSPIKGNMFFQDQFKEYINQKQGYDIFTEKIRPQIKQAVKQSLMCAVDGIQNRKNTHQMFGYDFMIDDNNKVWLIQINSSPSMDYSTHITSKLVKQGLQDIVKVVVDHASAPKKQRKHVDTGKFKKIYKGVEVAQKNNTAGLNLCLEGIPMKKPKKNTVKIQNFKIEGKN